MSIFLYDLFLENRRKKISSVEINSKIIFKQRGTLIMTKRKLKATDLFAIQSITNPVISPDGNEAVFIRTEMHKEDNKYYAYLYHVDIETNEITQWTHSKEKVS